MILEDSLVMTLNDSLVIDVCGIIGISKIKFCNFSSIGSANQHEFSLQQHII